MSEAFIKLTEMAEHNGETDVLSSVSAFVIMANQSKRPCHDKVLVDKVTDLVCELTDEEWAFLHAALLRSLDWYTQSLKMQLFKHNWIKHLDTMRAFRD